MIYEKAKLLILTLFAILGWNMVQAETYDPSKNLITFDDGEGNASYPQGSVRYNVNINSEGSGSDKNYYLQGGTDTNPLYITPLMTATEGEEISFDAEYINFSSAKVEVMISTDRQNWTTIQTISGIASSNNWTTYTATIHEAGNYYIGFKVTSAKIDNIYGLVPSVAPTHDLLLVASNIPATGKQNHDYVATASIGNVGPNVETAGSYTATLYVDGEAVVTSNAVNLPVADISGNYNNGEEQNYTQLSFTFKPHFFGEKPVYIEVASGEAVVTTGVVNVNFAEEKMESDVAISGTYCNNASLLHLNWNNSESVSLYTSAMLLNAGLKTGDVIESITFKGYCTNNTDYDTQLSVWYEKTTETEQAKPDNGMYDTSNMTQVLPEETHTWTEVGTSTELVDLITINLADPIIYDGTSFLRFLVRSEGSVYKSGTNFEVTSISGNGKSYYNRHDDHNSFENTQSWNQNSSVPAIHFGLKIEPKTLSGVVTKEGETTPVAGATVTIRNAENDVEYFATTDGNGAYTIGDVQNTLVYTATVTAEGYETLVDNEELHFTVNSQTKNYTLTPLPVVTIGQYGYATFYYSNSAYVIPNGVEAKAVGSIDGGNLMLTSVSDIIPAGCAVILKAGPGNYTFVPTSEVGTAVENMLRGTDQTETIVPEGQDYKYYKLSVKNDVVGFYYGEEDGAVFVNEAHKAYLPVPVSQSNSVRSFIFDNASGIANVQVNEKSDRSYNLSGQRVNDTYKGVVILNGKKVLRK